MNDRVDLMNETLEQWEASVADLWGRFNSFYREDGVAAMRELTEICPATDGRAPFEVAGSSRL